ncbi:methyltransferase domain-containing protein [Roseovarius atlanticus]|uniref:methyltransferase domain-containing protein n=1 Tax=Roseovarius atlanticus TaxID=1641875 RepID=UPI001C95CDEF|nr:methyltransferase domain-containing protein [Roseovarius atlanticus]MBY5988890.1 class I SAM-dependent methyltransferase [Roseovarius atlanticus]MBY6124281.1 class I SAM-dependent methyltransferase [Roseovarius atlanticus]MBY6148776.1 class I SAM-dependent methyltransferase [Roseovarius atlanticus]
MQAQKLAEAFVTTETEGYNLANLQAPRVAERKFAKGKRGIWLRRVGTLARWLDKNDVAVPKELVRSYEIDILSRVRAGIPLKYQFRALNNLRELVRANILFPELVDGLAEPRTIIDLSAGACGTYEVFSHFGHYVTVCDFYQPDGFNNVRDSYAAIHEMLGIECRHFDGRSLPYSFADDNFDIVLCHQAIDAYGPVQFWYDAIDEMLRIARCSIGLVLNPAHPKTADTRAAARTFMEHMRTRHGATFSECPETGLPAMRIDKT